MRVVPPVATDVKALPALEAVDSTEKRRELGAMELKLDILEWREPFENGLMSKVGLPEDVVAKANEKGFWIKLLG